MRMCRRLAACGVLLAVLVWFLADAGAVRAGVEEALALCARTVVPALFPFMVSASLLVSLGFGELAAPWLAGLMEPLFRVPGAGSAALLLGLEMTRDHLAQQGAPMGKDSMEAMAFLRQGKDVP